MLFDFNLGGESWSLLWTVLIFPLSIWAWFLADGLNGEDEEAGQGDLLFGLNDYGDCEA
jgi:hypothetical protein